VRWDNRAVINNPEVIEDTSEEEEDVPEEDVVRDDEEELEEKYVEDRSARQVSETGKGENRIVLDWFSQVTHEWIGVSESVKLHWTSGWMLREMLQYARSRSFTFSYMPYDAYCITVDNWQ
jgi:hypothetical protein